ncbi:MAG: M56 family metallopeptidase [Singulisphaera sp.]
MAAALALIVWGCGSLLLLLGVLRSCAEIHRLRRSASPPPDGALGLVLEDVCRDLGVHRPPPVVVSRRAMTPFAVGFRRPIVVLPERLIGAVDGEQMRDVLVHEVAHVLRGDHRAVLLQELARAMYWPIVPVHGLIRELGRAREDLCDNHVLRGRDAVSYGATLLHLAELSLQVRAPRASVGILHWKGELERRIAGLLDRRRSTMTGSSRSLACVVTLLFVTCGTIASATRFIAASGEDSTGKARDRGRRPRSGQASPEAVEEKKKPPRAAKRSMLVHVLGPDGRPMRGVEVRRSVWTRPPSKGNVRIVSDDRGEARFEIPENIDIYRIWARAKGHVPLFAHWEEQDNPEETLPGEFTFQLKRGTVIGGLVRDEGGKPIKGAAVEVELDRGGKSDGPVGPDRWLAQGDDTYHRRGGAMVTRQRPGGRRSRDLLNWITPTTSPTRTGHPAEGTGGGTKEASALRTATITMRGASRCRGRSPTRRGSPSSGRSSCGGTVPTGMWAARKSGRMTEASTNCRRSRAGRDDHRRRERLDAALKKIDLSPGMKPVDFRLEPGKSCDSASSTARGSRSRGSTSRSTVGAASSRSTTTGIPTSSTRRSLSMPTTAVPTCGRGPLATRFPIESRSRGMPS